VALDATTVYAGGSKQILACAKTGCGGTPTDIAAGITTAVRGLAIDSSNVYFFDVAQNRLLQCPKTGCAGTPTVLLSNVGGPTSPADLAVNSTAAYWMGNGGVQKCLLSGCPNGASKIANVGGFPSSVGDRILAVDDSWVYVAAEEGTVVRVPQ
jgi:hypothetical protein